MNRVVSKSDQMKTARAENDTLYALNNSQQEVLLRSQVAKCKERRGFEAQIKCIADLLKIPDPRKLQVQLAGVKNDVTSLRAQMKALAAQMNLLRIVILYSLLYSQPIGCAVGYLYLVVQSASWTVFKLGFS